jgi:predicted NBD/HSP70 family sugar kinase
MKKYNQKYIKKRNKGRILKLLIEEGPMSRARISKELGIVRSTVSEITNELIKYDIINEGIKVSGNIGKRPTLLHFNENYFYFIAVVISPYGISISICNLVGSIIAEDTTIYPDDFSADDILNSTMEKINELLKQKDIDINNICFISVGSPETFSKKTGKIEWAPYIRDWVGIDLKKFFEEKFRIEVILKDHVKLETLGEQWKSFNNISNMVYLVFTRGIGAGVVIDGKIREGSNGFLGEVAFLPVAEKMDYKQIKNKDKNLGYYESNCDVIKIKSVIESYFRSRGTDKNVKDFKSIVKMYKDNREIRDLINKTIIKNMALGIATIIIVLDPEIVVINGEIVDLGKEFLELLKTEVYNLTPYKRNIVFSKLRNKSGIYGVIKNGLNWIDDNIINDPDVFFQLVKKVKR